jgi:Uri superfamily endonuclease
MKGIYVLILKIDKEVKIDVGKMGKITFKKSFYAYVGSAMSGIHRLKRHLKNLEKGEVENKHWHIDFLIPYCRPVGWIFAECLNKRKEQKLAIYLSEKLDYVEGFGASDSRSPSHLFKGTNLNKLKSIFTKALKSIGGKSSKVILTPRTKKLSRDINFPISPKVNREEETYSPYFSVYRKYFTFNRKNGCSFGPRIYNSYAYFILNLYYIKKEKIAQILRNFQMDYKR